ncbi:MAG: hypothetical protein ATN33_00605 [Epulopiscium sp. Nele67-Bin001]|nr:MAG: hypothetical protein ATN33_00605 [Epulopiscium sp. Nele67-Bin001]
MLLDKINEVCNIKFESEQALLIFYQQVLQDRVGDFRLDEIGPIMSVGSMDELNGYINKIFTFNGKTVDMTDGLNWYSAAEGDLEWNGGLVRQGYFMYLADEYEKTGDEIYAATIVEHMLDYINNVRVYNPDGKPYLEYKKSTWRPFEAAGRAGENWPVALAKIINSSSMTAQAFAQIFWSIYEHAVFLKKYHWKHGNHAVVEVAAMANIMMLFKEFKVSDDWIKYGVDFLVEIWDELFYTDGYSNEMSGAYHWVAMRSFYGLMEIALNNGYSLPQIFIKRLQLAGWAEYYQQKPDYSLPVTNDSNVGTCHKSQLIKIGKLIGDEYIQYRLSGGTEGVAPKHVSYFFPSTMLSIMRSDWTKDAIYASFDMGAWGSNHMNEDQLNIEISAYGRNFITNSGRWRYTTSMGVDWIDQARYFKTTAAYNTVLVDGYNQMPEDASGFMQINDDYDYAKGVFRGGYGELVKIDDPQKLQATGQSSTIEKRVDNVVHTREVIFIQRKFFLVRDTITFDGEHSAQQLWHTCDGAEFTINGNVASTNFEDANLIIVQLRDATVTKFRGSIEPFRGWNCPKYDKLVASDELAFTPQGCRIV